jgi:hypothetical protein
MNHLTSKRFDRAVRLEVLRSRAAIEREGFAGQVEQLSVQASPAYMLGRLLGFRRQSWLKQSGDFLAQYPLILATLSSVLMGRSSRAARGAGVLLTLLQALVSQQKKDTSSEI